MSGEHQLFADEASRRGPLLRSHPNDQLRRSLHGGVLVMTAGVIALGHDHQRKILEALATFNTFEEGNDTYGEHDFGALEVEGERLFSLHAFSFFLGQAL